MELVQVLEQMKGNPDIAGNITAWRVMPARPGEYRDFPSRLHPRIIEHLRSRAIEGLYSHQAEAIEAVLGGENVAVATPTASGKTLCYNLPVLDTLLREPEARALYLFPTKALAQDQLAELTTLIKGLNAPIKTHTYDGDTPANARPAIRSAGHIVVTNPDMLHTGILPHHTKWLRLFQNLRFVVIDELHTYRGVFGSHFANVLRRLRRIARYYGSNPQFILSSATIANPGELGERLIESPVRVIQQDGSPKGERHIIFYNPPVVNRELGIRGSSLLSARSLADNFLANGIQTIAFTRSRLATEVLLSYLQEDARYRYLPEGAVRGYRGGYLPRERREIERGLRSGEVRGVVATNALELGIDIGQLEVSILTGYPGTVASTWQQMGRAGRRAGLSAAVLVASSNPLDQYIVTHPEYFFGESPENGLINPNNLLILLSHLKCAAFELPFTAEERFGVETTAEALDFLVEKGLLHRAADRWYWMSDSYPAEEISLRSASTDNFVVVDTSQGSRVIGEVDRFAAPLLIHEDAIYIHEGQQYHVDKLDWEGGKAYVRPVEVDYYTDAELAVRVNVLAEFDSALQGKAKKSHGEILVAGLSTIYKKIKLYTHENVGWGKITLPEQEMHTTAYWLSFPEGSIAGLTPVELQGALWGVGNVLGQVAPLFLMCDPRDLGVVTEIRSPFTLVPTIYIYDKYPAGIGLSDRLYQLHGQVLEGAKKLVEDCPCPEGCPSCVGPVALVGARGKANALQLLRAAGIFSG